MNLGRNQQTAYMPVQQNNCGAANSNIRTAPRKYRTRKKKPSLFKKKTFNIINRQAMHAHILSASQFVWDMVAVPSRAHSLTDRSRAHAHERQRPSVLRPRSTTGERRRPPVGRWARARYPMRGVNPRFRDEGEGDGARASGRGTGCWGSANCNGGRREGGSRGGAGQESWRLELEMGKKQGCGIEGHGRRGGAPRLCVRETARGLGFWWHLTWTVDDRWGDVPCRGQLSGTSTGTVSTVSGIVQPAVQGTRKRMGGARGVKCNLLARFRLPSGGFPTLCP